MELLAAAIVLVILVWYLASLVAKADREIKAIEAEIVVLEAEIVVLEQAASDAQYEYLNDIKVK